MTNKTNIYFCWIPSNKGITCKLLYGLDQNKDSHNRNKEQLLQIHELHEEYKDLKLSQLSIIFPYEGKSDEATKKEI